MSFSASSYQAVPAPSYAAYASPYLGIGLGQALADLPNKYEQGRQQGQARAMDNMFPDGLPKNDDGSPNIEKAVKVYQDKSARIKGGAFVGGLMPYLQSQVDFDNAERIARGEAPGSPIYGFGSPAPRPTGSVAGPAGPGNFPQRPSPPSQPQLSSAGTDNGGQQTINSLASEVFGERDVEKLLPRYAAAVGLTPEQFKGGASLSPQQEQAARTMMQRTARSLGGQQASSSEDIQAPAGPTSAAERGSNGPSGAGGAAENGPGGGCGQKVMYN